MAQPNQMPDADQFLMGGGVPSAKFETVGASVTGTITQRPDVQQRTDFDSGQPLFWPDGKPMLQLKVVLATSQRDPSEPDDDGLRAIYIKGNMQKAVQQAVRAAGAKGLEVGGTLTVTYSGNGEQKKRGMSAPKLYTATYVKPDPLTQVADPTPAAQPAPAPATPTEAPPAGVDPGMWASLTPEQRATVLAAAAAKTA